MKKQVDILMKGVTPENIEHKLLKAIKVVNGDEELANRILKKQEYKTSGIDVQEWYEAQYIKLYEDLTQNIYNGLVASLGLTLQKADSDLFMIKGKVHYNPKSGKPLTKGEWKLIKESISKYLKVNTKDLEEKMAYEQASLGTLLQRLESNGVRIEDVTKSQIDERVYDNHRQYIQEYDWFADELYPIDLGMERIGNNITGINDDIRKTIVNTLNEGLVNRRSNDWVSSELLNKLGDRNRDWTRIVAYESQYHFETGYLNSEIKHAAPNETVYMQAVSQPDACKYCKSMLNGKIYILTRDESLADAKPKDKHAEGYMVVGMTNVGRRAADYLAVIPLHPHCRCRWVRWYEEYAELGEELGI